jgi:GxxExxY protein
MDDELVVGARERERVQSIVGGFYAVYNYYGYGLSESVYASALDYELLDRGHEITRELSVAVSYKGRHVAWQRVYVVVDRSVIVETKATERLSSAARTQLVNYLQASSFEVAVLLHFGPTPHFERFVDHLKRRCG